MNHHKFLLSAPYDDVDVETEGPTFAAESLDPRLFATLHHGG